MPASVPTAATAYAPQPFSLKRTAETEREHILGALRQTNGNKSKAALLLGIDRKTLYNKLKALGIEA